MLIIKEKAHARAGLIGNPSDGYNGKTISVIVKNFQAEVILYEWPEIEIISSQEDQSRFKTVNELVRDVELHGYYGGIRLVKATIKGFVEYCQRTKRKLHDRTFSIRYTTNIPRQVGLAGSSAIIVATLRALMTFYEVKIPPEVQPSLALGVESGELGITAGLQDRVIQVYEGAVHMDFAKERMQVIDEFTCGQYTPLDPAMLPPLYIAYSEEEGEPTETTHGPLKDRYNQGVPEVVNAMTRFAELTDESLEAIQSGDQQKLHECLDANFDLRDTICDLSESHRAMIECAREYGASAKFAGSGGAIIGTYPDEAAFARMKAAFRDIRCHVIKPIIE